MTPTALATRVKSHWLYRLRTGRRGAALSVEEIAEVLEAEANEAGCWETYGMLCDQAGVYSAGAMKPVCNNIATRLNKAHGFGSISVVLTIINVILMVAKLIEWWRNWTERG